MGKGSGRRPGTGYAGNWDAIFKPPKKPDQAEKEQQEREQARPDDRRKDEGINK